MLSTLLSVSFVLFLQQVTHTYLGVTGLGKKEESLKRKPSWDFILGLCSTIWEQIEPSSHLLLYILS
jgi:hypothetical protein